MPNDTQSVDIAVTRHYVDTAVGRIHYADAGSGPPVLLLHQTPRSLDEFAELMPLLASAHRVVAMDMLGFGLSDKIPAPQTIEQFAQGAVALLDALGLEHASVLGHHTGATVAIEVAAVVPDRVRNLVLSSPEYTDADWRAEYGDGPGVDDAATRADGGHLLELWAKRSPYYPPGRPDILNRYIRDCLAPGVDPLEGHLACARYEMEHRIGRITSRVLILGAGSDPFALPGVEPTRKALVNAAEVRVEIIDGGMIPLMEQKTVEVAAATLVFLATV